MKKIIFLFFVCHFTYAQVGINTTSPNATLDIIATDPNAPQPNEGVLPPRVNALNFTATNLQDGMIVMLTNLWIGGPNNATYHKGLHQWDSSLQNNTGDWAFIGNKTRKKFINGYSSGNIATLSETTFDCISLKVDYVTNGEVNFRIKPLCGGESGASVTWTGGNNTVVFGTNITNAERRRISLTNGAWSSVIENVDVDADETLFGIIHLPNANKIYRFVICTRYGGGAASNKIGIIVTEL